MLCIQLIHLLKWIYWSLYFDGFLANEYGVTVKPQSISCLAKVPSWALCSQNPPHPQTQPLATTDLICATVMFPFLELYVNGTKQCFVICICLYSHSIMLLRFICAVVCISSSLIFVTEQYFVVRIQKNVLIHSPFDVHLDCLQLWAIMK